MNVILAIPNGVFKFELKLIQLDHMVMVPLRVHCPLISQSATFNQEKKDLSLNSIIPKVSPIATFHVKEHLRHLTQPEVDQTRGKDQWKRTMNSRMSGWLRFAGRVALRC